MRRTRHDRKHSSSRELLLRELEARDCASVSELAEATSLHENTVRGHLDRLRMDGYLRSRRVASVGRGRPSLLWYVVSAERRDPYAGLAIALTETISVAGGGDPELMRSAGLAWGARLAAQRKEGRADAGMRAGRDTPADRGEPHQHGGQAERIQELVFEVMQEQGFAPELATQQPASHHSAEPSSTGVEGHLLLRTCPILAAANENPGVVCAAHQGMVEGLILANGGRADVELRPFASPSACALRVTVAP